MRSPLEPWMPCQKTGMTAGLFCLVPSARLELAQLSPLPPQDSVSTNFTTTAFFCIVWAGLRNFCLLTQTVRNSNLKKLTSGLEKPRKDIILQESVRLLRVQGQVLPVQVPW